MPASAITKSYIELIPTISGITSEMRRQLGTIATTAANTLGDGFRQAATAGVNDINHAMRQITIPTQAMNSQLQSVAHQGGTALQNAMANVQVPSTAISTSTAQGAHNGLQGGLVSGIKAAGPKILAGIAALGIGAVVGKSIGTAMDIENGSAKTKASLGLNSAQADTASKASRNLYAGNYGDSLEGVSEATTNALSSFADLRNGSSSDIEAITKKALNMNSVFEIDTARSTQVASQLITTGFAKNGTEAMDMLSAAMQKVPANVREDITDALDEYSPFMQQLGLAGDKGMSLLVAGAQKGMYGIDKTGDALKEFTIRAVDMSTASQAGYDAIGLSQKDMAAQLLKGGDSAAGAFSKIVKGLQGIKDPVEQQTAALALFGTPLEDLGTKDIPKFLSSLNGIPGGMGDISAAAKQMDDDLSNTAAGSLESFKRNLEITFGEAAIPLVKELQPMLAQATTWITANKDEIQKWIHDIATAVGSVLGPAYQFIMPIVSSVTQFINDNKQAIHDMMPVIITLGTVIGGLAIIGNIVSPIAGLVGMLWTAVPAFWAAATASTGFGISLLPLIALGAVVFAVGFAIGTFLYNLATNFDGTMAWLHDSMVGIGFLFVSIGAMIANAFIGIVNLVPLAINAMINGVNGISGAIGIPAIPLVPMVPFVPFPQMATGGDILGPTTLVAGEKDPETIVNRGKMNQLMDDVINGRVGQNNSNAAPIIHNEIIIQKGVADDDESLAQKVALATAAATGAAWAQKRA